MTQPNPEARLWLFDFDNTLAALEREVDWPASRRELEAFLDTAGIDEAIFAEIPKGNLPLYTALHSRWLRAPMDAARVALPPLVIGAAPIAGAIDLLKAITVRGATAIIVTSNSSRTAARWLQLHRAGDLIRTII